MIGFTNLSEDKSIPMWCPAFSNHGWLFRQQLIIVIILIIYSPDLSKDLEEYISGRIASY